MKNTTGVMLCVLVASMCIMNLAAVAAEPEIRLVAKATEDKPSCPLARATESDHQGPPGGDESQAFASLDARHEGVAG